MTLPRRTGVSLWRQVQLHLERQVADGTLKPGDQLPTEAMLAERFGVNRHTVRRALAGMEDRGLIRVEQGRGTFVREPVLPYRVSDRTRFTENVTGLNRSPARHLLNADTVDADPDVAALLKVPAGIALTRLLVIGDIDGFRISMSEHLFPADRFPGLADVMRETGSVTATLQHMGVADYRRKWTRVTARMPTGREADLLGQPRTRPVLVSESVNVDPDGRPIEYGHTRFNSDWVQLVYEP